MSSANVALAQQPDARPEDSAPAIFTVNTSTNYSSSDYNGFGRTLAPKRPSSGTRRLGTWP